MYNTQGERLNAARIKLGKSQQDFANALGIKQVGISHRENNKVDISFKDALTFEEQFGIRAEWLLRGSGDMLTTALIVGEENSSLVSLKTDTSEQAINERFVAQINLEAQRNKLSNEEVARMLHVSASHYTQVKRGAKNMTSEMLAHAVLNLRVDANYVVAKIDSHMGELHRHKKENEKLQEENENLRMMISLLKEKLPESQKKRA